MWACITSRIDDPVSSVDTWAVSHLPANGDDLMTTLGSFAAAFRGLWNVLDQARRATVNILFLIIMIVILAASIDDAPRVPAGEIGLLEIAVPSSVISCL